MPVVTFCGYYDSNRSSVGWSNTTALETANTTSSAYLTIPASETRHMTVSAVPSIPTNATINSVKIHGVYRCMQGTIAPVVVKLETAFGGTGFAFNNSETSTLLDNIWRTIETTETVDLATLNGQKAYMRLNITNNTDSSFQFRIAYVAVVVDYTVPTVKHTKTLTVNATAATSTVKGTAKTVSTTVSVLATALGELPVVKHVKTIVANVSVKGGMVKSIGKGITALTTAVANGCKSVTKTVVSSISVAGLMDKLRPGTEHVKTIITNVSSGTSVVWKFGFAKTITANIVANVTTNKAIAVVKTVFAALKAKFSIPARAIKGASAGLQTRTVNLDTHERITKLTNKSRRVDIEVIKW